MTDLNVALILKLIDHVTGPSKAVMAAMRNVSAAVDGAGRGMIEQGNRLEQIAEDQRNKALGSAAGTAGLAASLYAAMKPAIEFENALAGVNKALGLSDPEALKALGDGIQDLSTSGLSNTAVEIAAIVEEAGKAGLIDITQPVDQMKADALEFANSAAQMAVAFDISAEQSGSSLSKWRVALGLGADESLAFADAINHVANNTGTTEAALLGVIDYVGAVGKSAGLSTNDIVGLSAAILSAGASPERAATGLKNFTNALTRGASMTDAQSAVMQQMGFDAAEMAERMQVDAKGAILDVLEAMGELPAAVRNAAMGDLFGQEAISEIAPLVGNLDALRASFDLVADPASYAGAMLREFQTQSGTTDNEIKQLLNNINAMVVTITTEFLPPLRDLMDQITPILRGVRDWAAANPDLSEGLGKAAFALLGFLAASTALRFAIATLAGPLGMLLRGLGWLLSLGATANPLGLLIVAVAGLAYAIYDNWDGIVAYFQQKIAEVQAAFEEGWVQGIWALVKEFNPITLLGEATIGLAQYIHEQLMAIDLYAAGVAMIQSLWNGAVELVGKMVADIKARLAGMLPEGIMRFLSGGGEVPAPDPAGMVGQNRPPISPSQVNGANVTVNQTVVAAPGMNETQLASEAARRAAAATAAAGRPRQGQRLHDEPEDG